MSRKQILTFLIGMGYLYAGTKLLAISPLLTPDNKQYFGMSFDLFHYSLVAIPTAILIDWAAKELSDASVIVSLLGSWVASSVMAILSGSTPIAIANMFIYVLWLLSFIFMARAFIKCIYPPHKS